jgi:hypothetical protein
VRCQSSVFSGQFTRERDLQDFKKLKVWDKGHELTLAVYRATVRFPKEELYVLTSQIPESGCFYPSQHRRRLWQKWKSGVAPFSPGCNRIR